MKKIRLLWVGRTKDRALAERIEYYIKLLSGYARVSIVEIREARGKDAAASREAEGKRILAASEAFLLLDDRGREYTSPEFARFIDTADVTDIVIGGAFGVSDDVRARARDCIALSRMTFTHEMTRMILLEQLFRAMTILKGRDYHH
ncbi:MAG TPA: 23S rRNA (pseudouridine(1915)-N(3))-methyltransferase RlmH [Dissulfurispiraceae bacterium]|nr:23S rRNA (pseudouridine(1915)-N(3))-methyltransferase RlmH [Dissulfurispiraceae bacterium]